MSAVTADRVRPSWSARALAPTGPCSSRLSARRSLRPRSRRAHAASRTGPSPGRVRGTRGGPDCRDARRCHSCFDCLTIRRSKERSRPWSGPRASSSTARSSRCTGRSPMSTSSCSGRPGPRPPATPAPSTGTAARRAPRSCSATSVASSRAGSGWRGSSPAASSTGCATGPFGRIMTPELDFRLEAVDAARTGAPGLPGRSAASCRRPPPRGARPRPMGSPAARRGPAASRHASRAFRRRREPRPAQRTRPRVRLARRRHRPPAGRGRDVQRDSARRPRWLDHGSRPVRAAARAHPRHDRRSRRRGRERRPAATSSPPRRTATGPTRCSPAAACATTYTKVDLEARDEIERVPRAVPQRIRRITRAGTGPGRDG